MPESQIALLEAQIEHEIHAGEYGPHIHGVNAEFANCEDGVALPIMGERKRKIEILQLLLERLRGKL